MKRSILSICLIGLVQLMVVPDAMACRVPRPYTYLAHDQAIEDATWIALATMEGTSVEGSDSFYNLKVIEYLKGSGPQSIKIREYIFKRSLKRHSTSPASANFFSHETSDFWALGSFYTNDTDCEIHPDFDDDGQKYLIFGPKDYALGFEQVTDDDLWLNYVRQRVAGGKPTKPFPKTAKDYFNDAKAIVRVTAEWKHNTAVWKETVFKGDKPSYINTLFISPAARLTSYLNPACADQTFMPHFKKVDFLYVLEDEPKIEDNISQSIWCLGDTHEQDGYVESYGLYPTTGFRRFEIQKERINLEHTDSFMYSKERRETYFPKATIEDEITLEQLKRLLNK